MYYPYLSRKGCFMKFFMGILLLLNVVLYSATFNVSTTEEMVAALDETLINSEDDTIILTDDINLYHYDSTGHSNFDNLRYYYNGPANYSLTIKSDDKKKLGYFRAYVSLYREDLENKSIINLDNINYPDILYTNGGLITNSTVANATDSNVTNSTVIKATNSNVTNSTVTNATNSNVTDSTVIGSVRNSIIINCVLSSWSGPTITSSLIINSTFYQVNSSSQYSISMQSSSLINSIVTAPFSYFITSNYQLRNNSLLESSQSKIYNSYYSKLVENDINFLQDNIWAFNGNGINSIENIYDAEVSQGIFSDFDYRVRMNNLTINSGLNPSSQDFETLIDAFKFDDDTLLTSEQKQWIQEALLTDKDGNPRIVGNRIDMGAYEYQDEVVIEDFCTENPEQCDVDSNTPPLFTDVATPISQTAIDGLTSGWHLLGTSYYITDKSIFDNATVVWKYENNDWSAYSAIPELSQTLVNSGFATLNGVDENEGFWVKIP